jgi:hypothetical protein
LPTTKFHNSSSVNDACLLKNIECRTIPSRNSTHEGTTHKNPVAYDERNNEFGPYEKENASDKKCFIRDIDFRFALKIMKKKQNYSV